MLSGTDSPLGEAAAIFKAPGVLLVIGIGAVTAMLGVLLSQLFGISRMMFAMARKGDLPAFLEKVHPEHKVPHIGIFVSGGIIILLSIFGTLQVIVPTASFTILLYYSITNIAVMKMRKDQKLYSNWIPAAGLVFCVSMAAFIDVRTIITGLLLLTFGFVLRFVKKNWVQDI